MEDPLGSIFNSQEGSKDLKQKLLNTTLELENLRNVNAELLNLLNMAYQERDEAKDQLQKLVNKVMMMPSTSNELLKKNNNPSYFEVQPPESLVMVLPTTKANSSITESNSLSHASSPIDAVSSPEFSNMNNVVVDSSHNNNNNNNNNLLGYPPCLNQNQNQPFAVVSSSSSSEQGVSDSASAVIDFLAKGKALPQQGRLLQAVMDAGPLLQNLLLAGPLPTWRNPPPLQEIKVPPLAINKDFDASGIELVVGSLANTSTATTWNSNSVLNFGGGCNSGSWNNPMRLTSNATIGLRNHAPSRNRQRGQIF